MPSPLVTFQINCGLAKKQAAGSALSLLRGQQFLTALFRCPEPALRVGVRRVLFQRSPESPLCSGDAVIFQRQLPLGFGHRPGVVRRLRISKPSFSAGRSGHLFEALTDVPGCRFKMSG